MKQDMLLRVKTKNTAQSPDKGRNPDTSVTVVFRTSQDMTVVVVCETALSMW